MFGWRGEKKEEEEKEKEEEEKEKGELERRKKRSFSSRKKDEKVKKTSLFLSLSLFLFFLTKRKIRHEVEGVLVAGRLLVLQDERRRGGEGVVRLSDGVAFRFFQIFSDFFVFFRGFVFFG